MVKLSCDGWEWREGKKGLPGAWHNRLGGDPTLPRGDEITKASTITGDTHQRLRRFLDDPPLAKDGQG